MKMFLAALMALSGSLFFLATTTDAEAGNRYRSSRVAYCQPVRHAPVYRTPVYHRPVYRTPAVSYRQVCRPAYRVQYYQPRVCYRPAPVYYRSYSRCR
ncbi:MAG: hypothetical protein R3F19_06805 [Verrucomicrobiales bacterium]